MNKNSKNEIRKNKFSRIENIKNENKFFKNKKMEK